MTNDVEIIKTDLNLEKIDLNLLEARLLELDENKQYMIFLKLGEYPSENNMHELLSELENFTQKKKLYNVHFILFDNISLEGVLTTDEVHAILESVKERNKQI